MKARPKVLVISSSVAYGAVGNAAITAALQSLEIESIALPTVVLSNHPGLGTPQGPDIEPDTLAGMLDTLLTNDWLDDCSGIVTGYFRSEKQVSETAQVIRKILAERPSTHYLCDPIIGDDHTGLYVPETVAAAIREHLLPLATTIAPNRFELEWLSGTPVQSTADVRALSPKVPGRRILATSVPAEAGNLHTVLTDSASTVAVETALREKVPHGTGDLLSGLFIGECLNWQSDQEALASASARLEFVLDASTQSDVLQLASGLSTATELAPLNAVEHA